MEKVGSVPVGQQSSSGRAGRHRTASSRWYVVETQPRKERLAVLNLERQSFRSVCPHFRKVRKHARRVESVLVPLFPGYVFVRFDVDNDSWRSINGTSGVRRLIGFDPARPQPLPDAVLVSLLDRCGDGVVASLIDAVQLGDAVRIISGPFAEQLAKIDSLDDKGRVRVLLDIMGRETSLRLEADCIAPAGA